MTGNDKNERKALNRLADALVDDILSASDEDILAEFQETHGDPDRHAAEMHELFEKTFIATNKRRLAAAKAGAATSRRAAGVAAAPVDIAEARRWLRAVLEAPDGPQKLTLAARKESELTDADIIGTVENLRELGVLPPDDDKGGKP